MLAVNYTNLRDNMKTYIIKMLLCYLVFDGIVKGVAGGS